MQTETNDHDFDNIPSYMEDLQDDTNLDLFSTNTNENNFPNFLDQDDDGDGTLTADEIRIELYTGATRAVVQANLEELVLSSNQFLSPIKQNTDDTYSANRITLVDTNGNDIPNYLDSTESDEVN